MIRKKRLIRTLQALIRINSENPAGNEQKIASWVYDYIKKLGITAHMRSFQKRRPNVIASIKRMHKDGVQRSLLITPHLDTVPAGHGWHHNPFGAEIRADRIYGLGASDCKGNLAVALEAMHSLCEERIPLSYDLVFAATADEECGSTYGLRPLLDKGLLDVNAVVVLDADDFNIIIAQKGLLHVTVTIDGKKPMGHIHGAGLTL